MRTRTIVPNSASLPNGFWLSAHAWRQMSRRSISPEAVRAVLHFGRALWRRRARIYVIGRREVAHYRRKGVDLSRYEGAHVVCTPGGVVQTVYRNRDLNIRGVRNPHRRHSLRGGRR